MAMLDPEPRQFKSTFQPCKTGNVACPKCFGETSYCITPRNAEHWPLGKPQFRTCDFCGGEGEVSKARAAEAPNLTPEPAKDGWQDMPGVAKAIAPANPLATATGWPSEPPKPEQKGWSSYD